MSRKLIPVAAVASFLTLGLSMPSCPGQAEMEQKITDLTARMDKAEKMTTGTLKAATEMKATVDSIPALKDQLMKDMAAQKDQITALEAKVAELTAKAEAGGKKKKK